MPRKAAIVAPKLPTNVAECIDAYYTARQARLDAAKALEPLVTEERVLKEHIVELLHKNQLQGAMGKTASAEIVRKRFPQVTDWDALNKFAKKKGNDDLLKVSLNPAAVQARWADNVDVPGVGFFEDEQLSIHKAKVK